MSFHGISKVYFIPAHYKTCVERAEYLEGHLELGRPLGVAGGLVGGPLDVHRHGEDRGVHWAGLREQAVLQARVDLVETHESVHGVVRIRHLPVQD